jgi:hypothetical protein
MHPREIPASFFRIPRNTNPVFINVCKHHKTKEFTAPCKSLSAMGPKSRVRQWRLGINMVKCIESAIDSPVGGEFVKADGLSQILWDMETMVEHIGLTKHPFRACVVGTLLEPSHGLRDILADAIAELQESAKAIHCKRMPLISRLMVETGGLHFIFRDTQTEFCAVPQPISVVRIALIGDRTETGGLPWADHAAH